MRNMYRIFAVLFTAIFMLFSKNSIAQIVYENKSVGISFIPSLQGRLLQIKDAIPGQEDSLDRIDKMSQDIGFGVNFRFRTGRDWNVFTSLSYQNMGFKRVKEDVNFGDVIHPNLETEFPNQNRIVDVTTIPRQIVYHNNYQFIDLSVLFGKDFLFQGLKNKELNFSWFFGGSIGYMFKHDLFLEYVSFTPYGRKNDVVTNTELDPIPFNISAIVGARMEIDVYPKMKLYLQPNIKKHLLFASYGIERHHLYGLNLEIGLNYSLEDKDPKAKKNTK